MTDIFTAPTPRPESRIEYDGVAFLHYCATCGKFGAFGYGVHLLRGETGVWFCREHRPGVRR